MKKFFVVLFAMLLFFNNTITTKVYAEETNLNQLQNDELVNSDGNKTLDTDLEVIETDDGKWIKIKGDSEFLSAINSWNIKEKDTDSFIRDDDIGVCTNSDVDDNGDYSQWGVYFSSTALEDQQETYFGLHISEFGEFSNNAYTIVLHAEGYNDVNVDAILTHQIKTLTSELTLNETEDGAWIEIKGDENFLSKVNTFDIKKNSDEVYSEELSELVVGYSEGKKSSYDTVAVYFPKYATGNVTESYLGLHISELGKFNDCEYNITLHAEGYNDIEISIVLEHQTKTLETTLNTSETADGSWIAITGDTDFLSSVTSWDIKEYNAEECIFADQSVCDCTEKNGDMYRYWGVYFSETVDDDLEEGTLGLHISYPGGFSNKTYIITLHADGYNDVEVSISLEHQIENVDLDFELNIKNQLIITTDNKDYIDSLVEYQENSINSTVDICGMCYYNYYENSEEVELINRINDYSVSIDLSDLYIEDEIYVYVINAGYEDVYETINCLPDRANSFLQMLTINSTQDGITIQSNTDEYDLSEYFEALVDGILVNENQEYNHITVTRNGLGVAELMNNSEETIIEKIQENNKTIGIKITRESLKNIFNKSNNYTFKIIDNFYGYPTIITNLYVNVDPLSVPEDFALVEYADSLAFKSTNEDFLKLVIKETSIVDINDFLIDKTGLSLTKVDDTYYIVLPRTYIKNEMCLFNNIVNLNFTKNADFNFTNFAG